MSVNHHNLSQESNDKALDQSTFALTVSSISYADNNQEYDEEFTLNPLNLAAPPKNRRNCLAFQVALTFPSRISQEVTKMVDYYEDTLENQAREFHRIVEQNHRLKKENNKLKATHLANQFRQERKENVSPFRKEKAPKPLQEVPPPTSPFGKNRLANRVSELQNLVLDKDRKINELNSEISDLMLKVRRYKKKLEQAGHN